MEGASWLADRSLAPLSDWPAGPHPSCNGRFVVPRHSVCTRLHASGSLDNPVTILQPSLSNSPSYLAHHQPPAPLAAAALVPRIISKYNHRPRTSLLREAFTCVRTYARVCKLCATRENILIHVCTEVSESWPVGHFLPPTCYPLRASPYLQTRIDKRDKLDDGGSIQAAWRNS